MTHTCVTKQQLSAYCVGETSTEDAETIAEHLASCASCERAFEQITREMTGHNALLRAFRLAGESDPFHDEPERSQALVHARSAWAMRPSVDHGVRPDADAPPKIPALLGDYELLEPLGHGGMGAVYKAHHKHLDKSVAIKLIRQDPGLDPELTRRFDREMKAAGRMEHPNIVRALDAGEADGFRFLVMELVEGRTTAEAVRETGPMTVAGACAVVRQVASGLEHIHAMGLVHRDIKPPNLMICKEPDTLADDSSVNTYRSVLTPHVKILDFGIALLSGQVDSNLTSHDQVMGTFDYIAPEQTRNAHQVDARADLYSLGCTLYFLLTGRPPFAAATVAEKLVAHQLEEPTPIEQLRSDVPPSVCHLVKRMMAKSPADRIANAAMVIETIDAMQDISQTIPSRVSLQHPIGRRRLACVAGLLALFVAGIPFVLNSSMDRDFVQKGIDQPLSTSVRLEIASSLELRVAQWVLSVGGTIRERHLGTRAISEESSLPTGDFDLVDIDLRGTAITTSDLHHLKGATDLQRLYLGQAVGAVHKEDRVSLDGDAIEVLADAGLGKLTHLYLYGVPVDDAGLRQVGKLESLQLLTLHESACTDAGLRHIAALKFLQHLSVSRTRIDGSGLMHLADLDLRLLIMLETQLDDHQIISMPTWPNLEVFRIDGCPLSDRALQSLARYPKITDLGANLLANASPEAWRVLDHLPNLKRLRLVNNHESVNDDVIKRISRLNQLQELDLSRCSLSDKSLQLLQQTGSLRQLNISYNPRLSVTAVDAFREAVPECRVIFQP
ncbi:MAG: protein kinase [Planctomycetota bacterium]